MRIAIQAVLMLAILGLIYLNINSVKEPIDFNKQKDVRYKATVERLKEIRDAQVAFKDEKGYYTGSFDTLIHFVKTDSLRLVKAIGSIPDSLLIQRSMKDAQMLALERGYITRDTSLVSVADSLFKQKPERIDNMRYVPFTNKAEFEMGAKILITDSKAKVPVFECKVHNDVLLKGLDRQLVVNLNSERKAMERYAGLKVGSLEEATNNAGNWEK